MQLFPRPTLSTEPAGLCLGCHRGVDLTLRFRVDKVTTVLISSFGLATQTVMEDVNEIKWELRDEMKQERERWS